jgi:hypothetical protein
MAEPDQPKKETVRIKKETDRIELPRPPVTPPPEPSVKPRQTVRIQLPVRETGNAPVPSSPQSAPAAPRPLSASVRPPSIPPSLGPKKETVRIPPEASHSAQKKTQPLMAMPNVVPPSVGPKEETARIPPEPLQSSQKKTQPLMAMPNVIPQNPAIAVAPLQKSSMLLYWMLLGISALILIIEIWTYFS